MRKTAMVIAGLLIACLLALIPNSATAAPCGIGRWVSASPNNLSIRYDEEQVLDKVQVATRVRVMYCNGGMRVITHVSTRVTPLDNSLQCNSLDGFKFNVGRVGNYDPPAFTTGCWRTYQTVYFTRDIPNQTVWGGKSVGQSVVYRLDSASDTSPRALNRVYF